MKKNTSKVSVLLGAHFSIAGGLYKAVETASRYHCKALQVFTKNASTWKERDLSEKERQQFKLEIDRVGITSSCSHGAYLINLASPDKEKWSQSKNALAMELKRSADLAIPFVIIHPGAHMGTGEKRGLKRIASAIRSIFEALPENPCRLLLETTAGQGSNLGYSFDQLAILQDLIDSKDRIGFCFDTCHVFAAGYDLRSQSAYEKTMRQFDVAVGLNRIYVMHLNDAKKGLGSKRDRHENIGQGAIGKIGFRLIMNDPRLTSIPKIIETPKKKDGLDYDRINLDTLRSFVGDG